MSNIKRWTAIGLGAVMVVSCSGQDSPSETSAPDATPATAAGEGDGEGGGSGEGGIDIARAAQDPIAYLTAIALVEAHIRAAKDAVQVGEREAAGEMFAHPVSEVLLDMAPVFQRLGVAAFDAELSAASEAVFAGEDAAAIAARADRILRTLKAAEARAPSGGAANPDVAAAVIADMIDRAALQYNAARTSPDYGPYLDGYGFRITAESWKDEHAAAIIRASPQVAQAIETALAQTRRAYPTAARPAELAADSSALVATASAVRLAL